MIPAGQLWDQIEEAVRRTAAADVEEIMRAVNFEYYRIAALTPWVGLRSTFSLDFTGKDSDNAMLLPADLAGIEAVWDGSNKEYSFRNRAAPENDISYEDYTYRYFYEDPVATALVAAENFNVSNGATTYTHTATWDADWIGEYVRFGKGLGFYKIASEDTLAVAYRGEQITDGWGEIRPAGTKRLSVRDYIGTFSEVTVTVYCWKLPLPLWNEYDMMLLPGHEALELAVLARILGYKDRKPVEARGYRGDYRQAISSEIAANPRPITPKRPVDRQGTGIRFR